MRKRLLMAAFAATPLALMGCGQDAPTEVRSVRLALQHTVVPGSDHGGRPFAMPLTQEVTHTPVWAGDPDGTGSALITVNLGQGEVCWDLSVSNIKLPATAAHIHKAAPGVRGPVVVTLSAPDTSGKATGCVSGVTVTRELLKEILASPDAFYVNVHTSDFAGGAVRGQMK